MANSTVSLLRASQVTVGSWLTAAAPIHKTGYWPKQNAQCDRRPATSTDRFRLPERVDDGTLAVPDDLVVPAPRLRVDRLAHRAEDVQRLEAAADADNTLAVAPAEAPLPAAGTAASGG